MTRKPALTAREKEEARKAMGRIVLASASPNRLGLLRECGVDAVPLPQDAEEELDLSLPPGDAVLKIARAKMDSCLADPGYDTSLPSIALDTMVLFDRKLLGKPHDRKEAEEMARFFSGKAQEVWTGMWVKFPDKKEPVGIAARSLVVFRTLTEEDIRNHLESDEWMGAAGGYRLQMSGWKLVERVEGSWTNVVGLPLEDLIAAFKAKTASPTRLSAPAS